VNGNFQLDLSRFQKPASAAPQSPRALQSAELTISSNPSGAEIQLDGAFVGNTPSTIGVSPGDHTIDVARGGYQTWERKIKVSSGKIDISADLVANAPSPATPATARGTPSQ